MNWRETLESQGFKQFPVPHVFKPSACTAWQKRIAWPGAYGDDDQQDTFVEVYQYERTHDGNGSIFSFEIESTFERGDGQSMRILLYSFTPEELIARVADAVDGLCDLRMSIAAKVTS